MKRPILHLLFWLVYSIYDTLLHYTWMGPGLPKVPETVQFLMAVKTSLTLLPVKLILVYYFIRVGVKKILSEGHKKLFALAEVFFVFAMSVILFRIIYYYLVYPYIYAYSNTVALLNARSIFISILEMGYIGGIGFGLKLYRLQTSAKEREKTLIKDKLQTELKFLRNQTNPHFLFNTLNNIYALARKKSEKTPEVVMKLAELLSFMLYESGRETIPVKEEIKMLEDYIDLQRIRYNERLSIRINKNIDDGYQTIAPLLLLPLVENAFKHGIGESRFDSFIHLDICVQENFLNFTIENSIETGKDNNTNSCIGLTNLKRQLELIYKEQELNVEMKDNRFKVHVAINLDSYEKIYLHYSGR